MSEIDRLDKELGPILWDMLYVSGVGLAECNPRRYEATEKIKALIESEVKKAELNIELYYLKKLGGVYDDIVSGVAKKQTNSTYYVTHAINTEIEIKHLTDRINSLEENR